MSTETATPEQNSAPAEQAAAPAAPTAQANDGGGQKKKKRKKRRKPPAARGPDFGGAPRFDVAELAALSGPPLWQATHPAVVSEVTEAAIFAEVRPHGHDPLRAAIPPDDTAETLAAGQEIAVRLLDPPTEAQPVPTASVRQARELEGLDAVLKSAGDGQPVPGFIVGEVKGGYSVALGAGGEDDLDNPGVLRAFLPRSQATHSRVHERNVVDAAGDFDVTELEPERANIVVSRKARLRAEAKKRAAELWETIKEGDKVTGRVRALVAYGAFLDIDGVDGLLHISDLSWDHRPKVAEMLTVGQDIEVVVLVADREKKRLKVGLKQLTPDPWSQAQQKLQPGEDVEGDIVALADFGAFVRLDEGVEGLVHLSEISWDRVKHPSQKFQIGQKVKARVLEADFGSRRISLSTKALEQNPFAAVAEKYPEGSRAKGKVKSLTEFGAFVELEEGVEGLVHIGEMSWTEHIGHPSEVVTIGEEIDIVVMSVDVGRQRVSCSIKRLEDNPWEGWEKKYGKGTRHKVKVSRVADRGAYFELDHGLEGYCSSRDLSSDPVGRAQDAVRVGDELELEVKLLDRRRRRVTLSARAVVEGDTRKAYADYKKKEKSSGTSARTTLGDAFKTSLAGLELAPAKDEKAKSDDDGDGGEES